MKRLYMTMLLCCAAVLPFTAQSADKMTEILEAKTVTYAQASYFPAVWLDSANEPLSLEQTAQYLADRQFLPSILGNAGARQTPITLEHLASLCMNAWKLKGGMMYSLTRLPHYAFRELQANGILKSDDDPSLHVDGLRAMNIMYACMELAETEIKK